MTRDISLYVARSGIGLCVIWAISSCNFEYFKSNLIAIFVSVLTLYLRKGATLFTIMNNVKET